ncbi:xanthine phosphoribosyltransferase [Pontibacillus halophilus JSM 076056 = DSM 19796]|uniref:Xanthine phosphoribosyltransferase n=1 Tax=Pontibacillus halophilus JSM 076056 = DSM 19796 TaxID=1385510 RepID=A0A0A5GC03_9BACI|nr:xanthine phosphoribosyltransferase [Pontibacillus halophilus]KGX89524.1 xanthine phosphoribosyltransferase [Pontibacillus halophilus JSM 076056 = DSM 19796]
METLQKIIQSEGKVVNEGVLKVDAFLNHGIDPKLMDQIGREFTSRMKGEQITKVVTVEASGIAPAVMAGLHLGVPVVFARKGTSTIHAEHLWKATAFSFTKEAYSELSISKELLNDDDRVLFIDDFLANGGAAKAILSIMRQSGATLIAYGAVIEKGFQGGGDWLRGMGVRVESLVRISGLQNGTIQFDEERGA